jgi:CRISPR/Cas system-associated exonuclease Cas4 (RecB family)
MKIKEFEYTAILGWSSTRYDIFSECKRKYFYQYYAKFDKEYNRDKIDFLKKMTSIPTEIGNISHDVIKEVLERLKKSTAPIDQKKFEAYVKNVAQSITKKNFFEIYYKEQEKIEVDQLFQKTHVSLNNFLESERFEWIKESAISEIDNWIIEPGGFGESRLDGLKLYCKVDFMFPSGEKIIILDWKTGKKNESKHSKQLVGYAAWASFHLDKKASDIEPIIVYLHPKYEEISLKPTEDELIEYKERILSETKEMYGYCRNFEENIPLDKEAFPMLEDTAICKYCNYKELCHRN